mgnify:CR=1 FL=1
MEYSLFYDAIYISISKHSQREYVVYGGLNPWSGADHCGINHIYFMNNANLSWSDFDIATLTLVMQFIYGDVLKQQ